MHGLIPAIIQCMLLQPHHTYDAQCLSTFAGMGLATPLATLVDAYVVPCTYIHTEA